MACEEQSDGGLTCVYGGYEINLWSPIWKNGFIKRRVLLFGKQSRVRGEAVADVI